MRQSFFGVPCRHIRMSLFAMINGRIEMRDALLCMGIILCLLRRLCMFEGRLGQRGATFSEARDGRKATGKKTCSTRLERPRGVPREVDASRAKQAPRAR